MILEKNIVVYDEFIILRKSTYCSVAEYFTIRGVKKKVIILNSHNRIVYDYYKSSSYLVNYAGIQQQLTIDAQNELFSSFSKGDLKTANIEVELEGDYKLNNTEYITDIPYAVHFLSATKSISIEISESVKEVIQNILFGIKKYNRLSMLSHEKIETDEGTLIFYEYDEILQKYNEKIREAKLTKEKELELLSIGSIGSNDQLDNDERTLHNNAEMGGWHFYSTLGNSIHLPKWFEPYGCLSNSTQYQSSHRTPGTTSPTPQVNVTDKPANENSLSISIIQPQNKSNESIIKNYSSSVNSISNKGSLEPEKKLRSFIATSRNLSIVKYLKNLYKDKCQICGEAIEISQDNFLSEVHHIKPLGVHNGPDVIDNAIVLCPNHHTMFDRGAITIDIDKKIVIHFNPENPLNNKHIELKHEINASYIAFHNMNIFINRAEHNQKEADRIFAKDEIATTIQTVDFGNIVTLQDMDTSELFDIKLEDKFNKDFMKPIEKVILQKYLNDIVLYDAFRYKIIKILTQ